MCGASAASLPGVPGVGALWSILRTNVEKQTTPPCGAQGA